MASQLNDPSITFKAWGWSENCILLLNELKNGSLSEDQFLGSCKPRVEIGVSKFILTIVLSLLLLGTAGGNILVITAILIVKKLRSPTNLLIVNLAVTDFLVSILVLPFGIAYQIFGYWPFNQAICNLYNISDVLLCTLSILSLCAISIDRYLAITRPFQYAAKRTPKRMLIMILISWLLSAAISIPPVFQWEQQNNPFYCGYSEELAYQIYATLTAFYIPLTVMLVLYGKILVLAKQMAIVNVQVSQKGSVDTQARNSSIPESSESNRCSLCPRGDNCTHPQFCSGIEGSWDGIGTAEKSRQSMVSFKPSPIILKRNRKQVKRVSVRQSQSDAVNNGRSTKYGGSVGSRSESGSTVLLRRNRKRNQQESGKGETHKAVTTLGVIMGCFTICWLPFFVSQLITPIINCFSKQKFAIPPTLFQIFLWLGYGNSFLNPLIYALFNREFRLPFLYILRFQCMDINNRLRTELFSHQFDLPRKSIARYSISSSSTERRRERQKQRGLSPPTNCHAINSSSVVSTIDSPNAQLESSFEKLIDKEEIKSVEEEPKSPTFEPSNNSLIPPLFSSLQLPTINDDDDLLKNNPPRPSQLISRKGSLASTRSNFDSYVPNLNIEYCRSAPADIKTWTRAKEFKPSQIPQERFRRRSEAPISFEKDLSTEQVSVL